VEIDDDEYRVEGELAEMMEFDLRAEIARLKLENDALRLELTQRREKS